MDEFSKMKAFSPWVNSSLIPAYWVVMIGRRIDIASSPMRENVSIGVGAINASATL